MKECENIISPIITKLSQSVGAEMPAGGMPSRRFIYLKKLSNLKYLKLYESLVGLTITGVISGLFAGRCRSRNDCSANNSQGIRVLNKELALLYLCYYRKVYSPHMNFTRLDMLMFTGLY